MSQKQKMIKKLLIKLIQKVEYDYAAIETYQKVDIYNQNVAKIR